MSKHLITGLLLPLLAAPAFAADLPQPPIAEKTQWMETRHGEQVSDDYRWLQEKTNPAVIEYLNAENSYTAAMTEGIKPFADALYKEFKDRTMPADLSVPARRGDYYYYTRIEAGKQYQLNCRRLAAKDGSYDASAAEEIMLDQNAMAEGLKFFHVGMMVASPDARLLAYTTDNNGFRQYELHVKDLASGKVLSTSMPRVTSVAWAADNKTLFVVQEDATTKRADRLFRVTLDGQPEQVYHEAVEQFSLDVMGSLDRKHIYLLSGATDTTEVFMLPADRPKGSFKSVLGRSKGHRYFVSHRDGQLYIRTNKDAKNFRLVSAPVANPKKWTEVIPHDKDTLLQGVSLFKGFLAVNEKSRALGRTRIYDFGSKKWLTVKFDDEVYVSTPSTNLDYGLAKYRISYQSPLAPPATIDVDMKTGERTVLKKQEVAGGFDFSQYETRRLWATARDGVKVPIWVAYKKGVKLDGSAPMVLYSYGSYGIAQEANFSLTRLSMLERGVIYAAAHIRGGNDMGEQWHDDGMLMHKKNTFNDFIDSAEYLVKEKWTSRERLAIQGGSAGGLLMGAVVNMRPDLFKAVHAAVPFVDVMNTMMDASLPLTTGEYLEWGNPNEKPAYDYMRSYSPYDNILLKDYPAMLVTTGLNDSQVMYWEPAKYVAKLRRNKTDSNPLLLKVNMGAGHGGSSGRYNALGEKAFEMAWLLSQIGVAR
ncbi:MULTISPECIES: S9 family peptidase [unclassified Duganella]|uniref:S9 family peptidase n=1 Tax=unclassified Duganella TaxID=2636909 RepID=UPI0006F8AF2F|nr:MULTISPECIES: S9 family peptidase [unclassified Duganella]KQV42964.1 protease 2 [Duganella sp. Root336D2]KRB97091.1 protease 2 [Duganella sp. Root198D2]